MSGEKDNMLSGTTLLKLSWSFQYTGSTINDFHLDEEEEINKRIKKILETKLINQETKFRVYKTYTGENWTLNRISADKLDRFGWILRILEPKSDGALRRGCHNKGISEAYNDMCLSNYIREQRLKQMVYFLRMPESKVARNFQKAGLWSSLWNELYTSRIGGKRPTGRPKSRWKDNMQRDLRQLSISITHAWLI